MHKRYLSALPFLEPHLVLINLAVANSSFVPWASAQLSVNNLSNSLNFFGFSWSHVFIMRNKTTLISISENEMNLNLKYDLPKFTYRGTIHLRFPSVNCIVASLPSSKILYMYNT